MAELDTHVASVCRARAHGSTGWRGLALLQTRFSTPDVGSKAPAVDDFANEDRDDGIEVKEEEQRNDTDDISADEAAKYDCDQGHEENGKSYDDSVTSLQKEIHRMVESRHNDESE